MLAAARVVGGLSSPTRRPVGFRGLRASAVVSSKSSSVSGECQLSSRRAEEANVEAIHPAKKFVASCLLASTLFTAGAPTAVAIDLVMADPSVKQYMDDRDDAMKMKCQNMMDCDGDRREYAKSENFVRRNSGDVPIPPECRVEEACTTDIVGAAIATALIAGLSGLTTSEKLEKMGKDANAVNGTDMYFGDRE